MSVHMRQQCNIMYMYTPRVPILPYSLDQTLLSISRHSRIVAAPLEVLNEIVAALE